MSCPASGQDRPRAVQSDPDVRRLRRRGLLPPELFELVTPPVKVGLWSGAAGAVVGVSAATLRGSSEFRGGVWAGTHMFAVGSSFWFARRLMMRSRGGAEQMSSLDKITVSAMAGSVGGAASGLLSGRPSGILSAVAFWTIFSGSGQVIANGIAASRARASGNDDRETSWFLYKWSPVKELSDSEFIQLLEDKMLKLDVNIAMVDDKMAELHAAHQARLQEQAARNPNQGTEQAKMDR